MTVTGSENRNRTSSIREHGVRKARPKASDRCSSSSYLEASERIVPSASARPRLGSAFIFPAHCPIECRQRPLERMDFSIARRPASQRPVLSRANEVLVLDASYCVPMPAHGSGTGEDHAGGCRCRRGCYRPTPAPRRLWPHQAIVATSARAKSATMVDEADICANVLSKSISVSRPSLDRIAARISAASASISVAWSGATALLRRRSEFVGSASAARRIVGYPATSWQTLLARRFFSLGRRRGRAWASDRSDCRRGLPESTVETYFGIERTQIGWCRTNCRNGHGIFRAP